MFSVSIFFVMIPSVGLLEVTTGWCLVMFLFSTITNGDTSDVTFYSVVLNFFCDPLRFVVSSVCY